MFKIWNRVRLVLYRSSNTLYEPQHPYQRPKHNARRSRAHLHPLTPALTRTQRPRRSTCGRTAIACLRTPVGGHSWSLGYQTEQNACTGGQVGREGQHVPGD